MTADMQMQQIIPEDFRSNANDGRVGPICMREEGSVAVVFEWQRRGLCAKIFVVSEKERKMDLSSDLSWFGCCSTEDKKT